MPPQPPGIYEEQFGFYDTALRWKAAEGEDRYRRGLYTFIRRTCTVPDIQALRRREPRGVHRQPQPDQPPLQALATLNDPAFVEAAGRAGQGAFLSGRRRPQGPHDDDVRLCVGPGRPTTGRSLRTLTGS